MTGQTGDGPDPEDDSEGTEGERRIRLGTLQEVRDAADAFLREIGLVTTSWAGVDRNARKVLALLIRSPDLGFVALEVVDSFRIVTRSAGAVLAVRTDLDVRLRQVVKYAMDRAVAAGNARNRIAHNSWLITSDWPRLHHGLPAKSTKGRDYQLEEVSRVAEECSASEALLALCLDCLVQTEAGTLRDDRLEGTSSKIVDEARASGISWPLLPAVSAEDS